MGTKMLDELTVLKLSGLDSQTTVAVSTQGCQRPRELICTTRVMLRSLRFHIEKTGCASTFHRQRDKGTDPRHCNEVDCKRLNNETCLESMSTVEKSDNKEI